MCMTGLLGEEGSKLTRVDIVYKFKQEQTVAFHKIDCRGEDVIAHFVAESITPIQEVPFGDLIRLKFRCKIHLRKKG